MKISIAICTWNRADMLRDTLQSLKLALCNAQSEVEIIVVNNNSTDDTDRIIKDAMKSMPIHRVYEPKPGVSNARNTAMMVASGEFLIWTDDDVIVHPNWLHAYECAFNSYPDVAFFGGPIKPMVESIPPEWLSAALNKIPYVYSILDLGKQPLQIKNETQLPYGANFAVRTIIQQLYHYNPELGRQPSCLWLAGEEAEVQLSMLDEGYTGWWIPNACVEHRLPNKRLTIRYLVKHGIGLGRTIVKTNLEVNRPNKLFLGSPILEWKKFFHSLKKTIVNRMRKNPDIWVPAIHNLSVNVGKLYESSIKSR